MPIFRVKCVKIYTGQKKFTRIYSWRPWQISGMCAHHFVENDIDAEKRVEWPSWFETESNLTIRDTLPQWQEQKNSFPYWTLLSPSDGKKLYKKRYPFLGYKNMGKSFRVLYNVFPFTLFVPFLDGPPAYLLDTQIHVLIHNKMSWW